MQPARLIIIFLLGFFYAEAHDLEFAGQITKNFFWDIADPVPGRFPKNRISAICNEYDMTLASLKDPIDQQIIEAIKVGKTLNGNQGYNFFLSGSDEAEEGTWLWGDGSPLIFNRWNSNWSPQPAPNRTDLNCMFASATYWTGWQGNWFTDSCDALFSPLCEGKKIVVGVSWKPAEPINPTTTTKGYDCCS